MRGVERKGLLEKLQSVRGDLAISGKAIGREFIGLLHRMPHEGKVIAIHLLEIVMQGGVGIRLIDGDGLGGDVKSHTRWVKSNLHLVVIVGGGGIAWVISRLE